MSLVCLLAREFLKNERNLKINGARTILATNSNKNSAETIEYTFKEIAKIEGSHSPITSIQMFSKKFMITVTEDGKIIKSIMKDEKVEGSLRIIKKDSSNNLLQPERLLSYSKSSASPYHSDQDANLCIFLLSSYLRKRTSVSLPKTFFRDIVFYSLLLSKIEGVLYRGTKPHLPF